MKKILCILLLASAAGYAQKQKPIKKVNANKPIILKPKADSQTISFRFKEDELYFSKADLVLFMEDKALIEKNVTYRQTILYVNGGPKKMEFKLNDTISFENIGQRNLYKILKELSPEMLAAGRAADKVNSSQAFVKQILVKDCETGKGRKLITEKNGRVIFTCD